MANEHEDKNVLPQVPVVEKKGPLETIVENMEERLPFVGTFAVYVGTGATAAAALLILPVLGMATFGVPLLAGIVGAGFGAQAFISSHFYEKMSAAVALGAVEGCLRLYGESEGGLFFKYFNSLREEDREEVVLRLITLDLDKRVAAIDDALERKYHGLLERVGAQYVGDRQDSAE